MYAQTSPGALGWIHEDGDMLDLAVERDPVKHKVWTEFLRHHFFKEVASCCDGAWQTL